MAKIEIDNKKMEIVRKILYNPDKKFIVVDGLISAGKTTLIRLIEEYLNNLGVNKSEKPLNLRRVKAIFEPVEKWNETGALQYFYENIPQHCYEFQTYTYITRIKSVIDEIYNNPDAEIYILERSVWTDRYIFMDLLKQNIGDLRMTMYNEWCDLWSMILPLRVDRWVFLDTSLEESLKRIQIRNRNGENNISPEYQRALYEKHIVFYDMLIGECKNVVKIGNELMDADFINNDIILKTIIKKIIDF